MKRRNKKMDLRTVETVLVAVAPAFAAVCTILGCMIKVLSLFKKKDKEANEKVQEAQNKLQKAYDDIAKIQVKCESMEKFLVEMKEKKGAK